MHKLKDKSFSGNTKNLIYRDCVVRQLVFSVICPQEGDKGMSGYSSIGVLFVSKIKFFSSHKRQLRFVICAPKRATNSCLRCFKTGAKTLI